MNRLTSDKFFVALFLLFLAAMAGGTVIFALGMRDQTYVINDGVGYITQFINRPKYESHLQGLIFAFTFFIAGVLLAVVIMIPSGGAAGQFPVMSPPQPRQRSRVLPGATAAQQTAAQPAQPAPAPAQEPAAAMVVEEPAPPPPPPVPAKPDQPTRSVEEEVLAQNPDDLPRLESQDSRFEDTGEDDVVYGTGRVTDDSCWDFVQRHPDSAVKFLYRKTLDNKPLSTADEDIYRRWEQRGMTRAKIREIVLEIMGWKSLPDDFPHNIWRELRDQVFDMR